MARPATLYRSPKGATFFEGPKLTAAEIAASTPPLLREAGRLLDCTATMEAEPVVRLEWSEANCSTYEDDRAYPQKAVTVEAALRNAGAVQNILLAWQGKGKVGAGSVTISDEPTRGDITKEDAHVLALPSDGTATIVDDLAAPAVEGTNWEWANGSAQVIRILDVTSLTLPLKISYDTAPATEVGIMNDMGVGRHIVVQGVNAEGGCTQEIMELYNVMPEGDYADVLNLPPDATDESPMTIRFTATAHPDMPADPDLGTIGRIIRG